MLASFGQNDDNINDSVEARYNLHDSGQDQDELQRSGATLICCEESNEESMEGEYKRI